VKEDKGKLVADEGDFQIELTSQSADGARPYVGKEVLFGIRPEDLVVVEKSTEGKTFAAKVEVVEPLGAEILMYVSTDQNPSIIVRTPPHFDFHVGDPVELEPALEKIHFFDTETEKAFV